MLFKLGVVVKSVLFGSEGWQKFVCNFGEKRVQSYVKKHGSISPRLSGGKEGLWYLIFLILRASAISVICLVGIYIINSLIYVPTIAYDASILLSICMGVAVFIAGIIVLD